MIFVIPSISPPNLGNDILVAACTVELDHTLVCDSGGVLYSFATVHNASAVAGLVGGAGGEGDLAGEGDVVGDLAGEGDVAEMVAK